MNPRSDLESLPTSDVPDKIVIHAYAALIGEKVLLAGGLSIEAFL